LLLNANSAFLTDLDDEAQAKIEEMMFNERQKKMGLPQTHEKVQLCDKSIVSDCCLTPTQQFFSYIIEQLYFQ
jgi:hypothetical protein